MEDAASRDAPRACRPAPFEFVVGHRVVPQDVGPDEQVHREELAERQEMAAAIVAGKAGIGNDLPARAGGEVRCGVRRRIGQGQDFARPGPSEQDVAGVGKRR